MDLIEMVAQEEYERGERDGFERGVRAERARCLKIARDQSEELYDQGASWGAFRVAQEIEKEPK